MNHAVIALLMLFASCCKVSLVAGVSQNILVQQNVDGSSFFDRTWSEFKAGFGSTSGNYWLGNEQLHTLTQGNKYKLRFELQSTSGLWYWAEYDTFTVGDESTQYTLTVAGFNGNVTADAMTQDININGMKFTTKDRDNDMINNNCAQLFGGGFWYNYCGWCDVNGAGGWFVWYYMSDDFDYYLRTSRMWLVVPDINECETGNGGCQMICVNTAGSFRCECNSGYTLNSDGLTCSDINECATGNGGCDMKCTNTEGSFTCDCDSGYFMEYDGATRMGCRDVNECATGNGGCQTTCTNTEGSFTCSCDVGYTLNADGRTCSVPAAPPSEDGKKDHKKDESRVPPGLEKQGKEKAQGKSKDPSSTEY